ncbi:unnamed protein product [Clonostachys byssicola]|uniref:Uncharacterized protein n=1 Tax=Clonostachys byssicola TaxID=160290 RepID=A0A9N9UJK3_9HYPO|nr:unnamed protein product [Clonostachys byssicola]
MFFSKSVLFDPSKDIPSLKGRVILVTGATTGLGKQSVFEYARHDPAQIWLSGRTLEKATQAAQDIIGKVPGANISPLEMDLTSFDSIRKAAQTVLSQSQRLDILLLNAGIMATAEGLTKDGYEIQMGTNHMGHALLTRLLLPLLEKTKSSHADADVRVISLSSYGHTQVSEKMGFRFDTPKTTAESLGAYGRYFQSKLANVLFARQLAKEYPQLITASVHPGLVSTDLMNRSSGTPAIFRSISRIFPKKTVEDGAKNQLWASVSKDVTSGEYYEPIGVPNMASKFGKDDALAKKVWDWTQKELDLFLA